MTLDGPRVLAIAMFFASFAWSFVFISLPFHIQQMSPLDPTATLRWAGWILGITSLITVVTGPVWGRLAGSRDPKGYYLLVELLQGFGFFGMAAARTLFELFVARFALGFMGASSTFAFILASRSRDAAEVRRRVAAVQASMTVGQVVGPLAGAIAAARLGFRPSFVLGGLILLGCAAVVHWGLTVPDHPADIRPAERPAPARDLVVASSIVLAGSTQLFFLTAVLPQILTGLGVAAADRIEIGGLVVFASAAAAALGAVATPRLGAVTSERRLIAALLVASSGFMAVLSVAGSVWSYTLVRFLQVLCIAPVFPLVVARIAHQASGAAIGIINSARIGAAFVGPVIATSVLAGMSPIALYMLLALIGLVCVPLALLHHPGPTEFPTPEGPAPAAPSTRPMAAARPGPAETLRRHTPRDAREAADLERILAFVGRHADPFDREIAEGHLTGSALVVSALGDRVLLLHHRKLGRWLQPGGHADPGEADGQTVALREAREETGIEGLALHATAPRPLDVDVHEIPARGAEAAHLHLDLRYLVTAPDDGMLRRAPGEAWDLRWFRWDELDALELDRGLRRALASARAIVDDHDVKT